MADKNSFKGLETWLSNEGTVIVGSSRLICEDPKDPHLYINLHAEKGDGYSITVSVNPDAEHGSKHHKCHCELCGTEIEGVVCKILGEVTVEENLGIRGNLHLSATHLEGKDKGKDFAFSIRSTVDDAISGIEYEYRKHFPVQDGKSGKKKILGKVTSGGQFAYEDPKKVYVKGAGFVNGERRRKLHRAIAEKKANPVPEARPRLVLVK